MEEQRRPEDQGDDVEAHVRARSEDQEEPIREAGRLAQRSDEDGEDDVEAHVRDA